MNIGLIAHDSKKKLMQNFCIAYRQQLCTDIEQNQLDLVIFMREPEVPKRLDPDSSPIVRVCDMHNIPLATNVATAELLVKALERGDLEWREIYK